jgi:hypothetical protein
MAKVFARKRQRQLAQRLTCTVAALHAALVLTLALDDDPLPLRVGVFELLWAAAHEAMFYPLVAVLVAGPVLSWLAWRVPGRHRYYLLGSWAALVVVLAVGFPERIALMLEVLHWRVLG